MPLVQNHPRLILTSSKLTELTARKNVPTAEYLAVKTLVDSAQTQWDAGYAKLTN